MKKEKRATIKLMLFIVSLFCCSVLFPATLLAVDSGITYTANPLVKIGTNPNYSDSASIGELNSLKADLAIEQGIVDMNRKADRRRNRMSVGDKAVISLRFDDGTIEDYTKTFPALKANQLIGSFAIIPNYVGLDGTRLNETQINEMVGYGMEICSHSYTHATPGPGGSNEAENHEIIDSKDYLSGKGWKIDTFVTPGTWSGDSALTTDSQWENSRLGRIIRANYLVANQQMLSMWDDFPLGDRYGLSHFSTTTFNLSTLEGLIDDACNKKTPLGLLFHSTDFDKPNRITTEDFATLCRYIKTKRDAGLLEVLSIPGVMFASKTGARETILKHNFDYIPGYFKFKSWYGRGTILTDGGYSGSNYAKVSNATPLTIQVDIPVELRGSTVMFKSMAKRDPAASAARVYMRNSVGQTFLNQTFGGVGMEWVEVSRPFTIPQNTTYLYITIDSIGTTDFVYFDDLEIVRL